MHRSNSSLPILGRGQGLLFGILALCLASRPLAATPLSSVALGYDEGPAHYELVQSTLMDGSAWSWRINPPRQRSYVGLIAGLGRPGSGWFLLDAAGRLARDPEAERLFETLDGSAKSATGTMLVRVDSEDSPYYFPGWVVTGFRHTRVGTAPERLTRPLTPGARSFVQVLPDPSLLDRGLGLRVCLALKTAEGSWEAFILDTEDEYLHGEKREIFAGERLAGLSQLQLSLALFATAMTDEDSKALLKRAALETYPGLRMEEGDWDLGLDPETASAYTKKLLTQYLNTILHSFEGGVFDDAVFGGLDSPTWFETLYGVNRENHAAVYFRYCFDAGMPVLSADVDRENASYDWTEFVAIDPEEGDALAAAAKALVGSSGEGGDAGAESSGLDFLARVVAATPLRDWIEGIGPRFPAAELALRRSGARPASGSPAALPVPPPKEGGEASSVDPSAEASFTRVDIEKICLLVPAIEELRVGDLLVHEGNGEDLAGDPPQIAVVTALPSVAAPAPGTDPLAYLRGVRAVTLRKGGAAIEEGPLLGDGHRPPLFSSPTSFNIRRLLVKRASAPPAKE